MNDLEYKLASLAADYNLKYEESGSIIGSINIYPVGEKTTYVYDRTIKQWRHYTTIRPQVSITFYLFEEKLKPPELYYKTYESIDEAVQYLEARLQIGHDIP